ncbi:CRISPR-associated endonuclease Cas3'' [Kutzneria buriramensis]|uniref:CRISPR-associated endonuclease/helicase Cas3 n=1 Tax=Kutzneria buriramensis TaxID=1045776 RepID=A0A3E0GVH8_9PSEU|nr:CRISPR-associated endonuclease Cas3'' [Kutzneria buriramensis]REH30691.1 CRISPR-associated endonuclease/helicase Cas3 [Kutzneria buriramensis]
MPKLWGKRKDLPSDYPLLHHLIDTAAAAYVLWDKHLAPGVRAWLVAQLGLDDQDARRFVAFLAGLHDVGKACPCFQDEWPPPGSADYVRHEQVSYLTLPTLLNGFTEVEDPMVESVAHRIAEIAGGHHGEFQSVARRGIRVPGHSEGGCNSPEAT